MQFERFHGIALLALGALLLSVGTVVIFKEKAPAETASPRQTAPRQPGQGPLSGLDYVPGALGVVLAVAGAYVLARASHKGNAIRTEDERQEQDRSSGPQGHHVSTPTIWKER